MALCRLLALLIFVFTYNLGFSGSSHKNIVATKTESKIKIDGLLSEGDWNKAVPVSDFVQYDPVEGAPPTERTSVRILYNDYALYVGVICYDSEPSKIRQQLTRRDRSSEADRFSITIDSYNDGQTGFVFVGNVSGVQSDGVLYHDGIFYDIEWDAIWNYEATITTDGWSAEFEIPFSALRFQKQEDEYVWGINFRRYISRKKEIIEWVLIPRSETGSISKIGNLSGLKDISQSLHLSILPYALARTNFEQELKPYNFDKVFFKDIGVDIKYGLTSNFTLDAAINPDFGQVEVDQEVMNLTVFETHFPEKRPFFLEGGHIFKFGISADEKDFKLFYTRRIGRKPRFDLPDDVKEILRYPKNTTIIGAAKLTGKNKYGTDVGFISTITDEERLVYKDTSDHKKYLLIEPMASYNVLRLSQEIGENSSVGFMGTGAFLKNYSPSLAGGFDWNFRISNYQYAVDGYIVFSRQNDAFQRQTFDGTAGKIFIGRIAAKHWLFNTSYDFATKNFSIDELGYFSQPREHGGTTQIIYKEDQAENIFLRYNVLMQADYRWNYQNLNTTKNIGMGSNFIFKNFWTLSLFQINQLSVYNGSERGIIDIYKTPTVHSFQAIIQSDTRKIISVKSHLIYEIDKKQKKEYLTSFDFTYKPTTWIELTPMLTYAKRWNEETGLLLGSRYVTSYDSITNRDFTVFGDRDLNYFDIAMRGIVTLSNKLSVQFFYQLMFYKWHYRNFKKLTNLDTFELIDFPFYYQDLNFKIMNTNVVLRWEFLPGSTLFFVWTHMKENINNLYFNKLNRDISEIFKIIPDNVFLIKLNYWLNF
ncbi:MAG: hypothetical protein IGBAC_0351 [Ignavibacteriae bacterium]|nr:MAG: hypothetical protein IGBAC_0351 [Ignavibacteriota bacterium]